MRPALPRRVAFLGDAAAGKTALVRAVTGAPRPPEPQPTVGAECALLHATTADGIPLLLLLWDVAGNAAGKEAARHYLVGADAVVFVFDCTSRRSFDAVAAWLEDRRNRAAVGDARVFLVANKTDRPGRWSGPPTHPQRFAH